MAVPRLTCRDSHKPFKLTPGVSARKSKMVSGTVWWSANGGPLVKAAVVEANPSPSLGRFAVGKSRLRRFGPFHIGRIKRQPSNRKGCEESDKEPRKYSKEGG
jgi:hypothetical protein